MCLTCLSWQDSRKDAVKKTFQSTFLYCTGKETSLSDLKKMKNNVETMSEEADQRKEGQRYFPI